MLGLDGVRLRPVVSFLSAMTLTACLGLALARVTANSPRAFPVLDSGSEVMLAGQPVSVDELARRYRPQVVELPRHRTDRVVDISYEAWPEGSELVVTYFVAWADEEHPNLLIDGVYGLFRWAYYHGRRDIEYIQVRLSPQGIVREVHFESAADLNPWAVVPTHVEAVATVEGQGLTRRLLDSRGDRPVEVMTSVPADGRIPMYVATWNHLFDIVPPPVTAPGAVDSPIPVHRGAASYRDDAGARRAHPSAENVQTPSRALAGRVGVLLYVTSPVFGLLATRRRTARNST